VGFTSNNCGTWTSDLSQITTSKSQHDDGTYIVDTDLTPGTWKSSGSPGCYWERESSFTGGGVGSIIANNNTDSPAIVTVLGSDKGFKSNNCGTWTRL
jgi:hypothetical protein